MPHSSHSAAVVQEGGAVLHLLQLFPDAPAIMDINNLQVLLNNFNTIVNKFNFTSLTIE
jgi:hypothetical protein